MACVSDDCRFCTIFHRENFDHAHTAGALNSAAEAKAEALANDPYRAKTRAQIVRLLNLLATVTKTLNKNSIFAKDPMKVLQYIANNVYDYIPFVLYDEIEVPKKFIGLVPNIDGMSAWESLFVAAYLSLALKWEQAGKDKRHTATAYSDKVREQSDEQSSWERKVVHLTCAYGYMCEVTNRDEDEIEPEDLDWLYTNTGIDGNNVLQRGDADYSDVSVLFSYTGYTDIITIN